MNSPERDRLLKELADFIKEPEGVVSRLDERTKNMWQVIEKMEKHQVEQNGYIKETMEKTAGNSTWVVAFRYIIIVAASLLGTHLFGLW